MAWYESGGMLNPYNYLKDDGYVEQAWNELSGQNARDATAAAQAGARNEIMPAYNQLGDQAWYRGQQAANQAQAYMGLGQQYLGNYQNFAEQPNLSQSAYANYAQNFVQPSDSAAQYGMALNQFAGPSNTQQYGTSALNQMGGQSRTDQHMGTAMQNLQGQTNAGQMYTQMNREFGNPSQSLMAMENFRQAQSGSARADRNVRDSYRSGPGAIALNDPSIRNTLSGATQGDDFFAQTRGDYMGPGMGESRVQQALTGGDPQLQRQIEQQNASINQEMIARGGYGSGKALKALAEGEAAIRAQRTRDLDELSLQAQDRTTSRLTSGQQAAVSAGQQQLARGQSLQDLAQTQRQTEMAERDMLKNWFNRNQEMAMQFAGQSDQQRLSQLALQAQAGNAADQANLDRTVAGMNFANQSDQNRLARAGFEFDVGQGMDQNAIATQALLSQMAGQSDANRLAGTQAYMDASMGLDQFTDDQQRWLAEQGIDLNTARANIPMQQYAMAAPLWTDAYSAGLNALANSYGIGITGAQNSQANSQGMLRTFLESFTGGD